MIEQQDSIITDEMRALIGKEVKGPTSEPVTVTEIRRFSQAVFDNDPVHYDTPEAASSKFGGVVAPGPFASLYGPRLGYRRYFGEPDPMVNHALDWTGNNNPLVEETEDTLTVKWPEGFVSFHGGDEMEILQLAKPGERISSTRRISEIREREGSTGRLGFVVAETIFTNEKGEVLCINRLTSVARNPNASKK